MLACKAQWAKYAELRELCDNVKKVENEWKKPAVQFEEAGEETEPDEDWQVEVDSEAVARSWTCEKERALWMRVLWRVRRKRGSKS